MRNYSIPKWKKVGLIIKPNSNLWWAKSHAMVPTPEFIQDDVIKIYFSGRDDFNRSHIGYAIIDLNNPTSVIDYSTEPILLPGELGCFDDNGVTPSCLLNVGDMKYLYYIGWNPGTTVRMHIFGGLAISKDEGRTFERWSRAPIIERNKIDPFINTGPWVVRLNDQWRMYYVSGVEWVHKDLPRYNIKLATSIDGKTWMRNGHTCIDFSNKNEVALARPYVVHDDGMWKMWYAYKGDRYQIGYAESEDGLNWDRKDELAGLACSTNGFDSEMIEYAGVVKHKDQCFMFYNGNNYGYDGIGLAIEE